MIQLLLTLLVISSNAISDDRFPGAIFSIDSSPDSADVYANGILLGQTPLSDCNLDPGKVLIQVKKNGYDDYKKIIAIKPFQNRHLISMIFLRKLTDHTISKLQKKDWLSDLKQTPEALNSIEHAFFGTLFENKINDIYGARCKVLIDNSGNVMKTSIVKSTGDIEVDNRIIQGTYTVKYKPLMAKNNKSIKYWMTIPVKIVAR